MHKKLFPKFIKYHPKPSITPEPISTLLTPHGAAPWTSPVCVGSGSAALLRHREHVRSAEWQGSVPKGCWGPGPPSGLAPALTQARAAARGDPPSRRVRSASLCAGHPRTAHRQAELQVLLCHEQQIAIQGARQRHCGCYRAPARPPRGPPPPPPPKSQVSAEPRSRKRKLDQERW